MKKLKVTLAHDNHLRHEFSISLGTLQVRYCHEEVNDPRSPYENRPQ